MNKLRYHYKSVLAPHIEGLVKQKKANGFVYDSEAYILKLFDRFYLENGYNELIITRDISMQWATQKKSEGNNFRRVRVSCLRQLSLYMNSMGIESYIPHSMPSATLTVPYLLDRKEIAALFYVIDTYLPQDPRWHRFSMEYQVLYRMYYCCGMRVSEACCLKKEDVNLDKGILTVRQSKGNKDRLVYMADDLTFLCRKYSRKMEIMCPDSIWYFPRMSYQKHLDKSHISAKFKKFWRMTPYAEKCSKEPTPHGLRHAFVINRLNQWMEKGLQLDIMMPYLSRYLGHSDIEHSMYYYHHVKEAFQIVRQKDQISEKIIPEVIPYE